MTWAEREEQRRVLERLRGDARRLAACFELPLESVEAERPQVKRRYGVCYSDGSIRIRLRHARTGRLLKYSGLVDTLCHELAHLRYFDHGLRFRSFYQRLLGHARRAGIYRPDPRRLRAPRPRAAAELLGPDRCARLPRQLELFDPAGGDPRPPRRAPCGQARSARR